MKKASLIVIHLVVVTILQMILSKTIRFLTSKAEILQLTIFFIIWFSNNVYSGNLEINNLT